MKINTTRWEKWQLSTRNKYPDILVLINNFKQDSCKFCDTLFCQSTSIYKKHTLRNVTLPCNQIIEKKGLNLNHLLH